MQINNATLDQQILATDIEMYEKELTKLKTNGITTAFDKVRAEHLIKEISSKDKKHSEVSATHDNAQTILR